MAANLFDIHLTKYPGPKGKSTEGRVVFEMECVDEDVLCVCGMMNILSPVLDIVRWRSRFFGSWSLLRGANPIIDAATASNIFGRGCAAFVHRHCRVESVFCYCICG